MSITRYHGQPLSIEVKFKGNPLTAYGKTYDDITDISMNFKRNLATDADDAYLEKKQSTSGVVLNEDIHSFKMIITEDDYANLVAGTTYYLTLNVEVSGVTNFIELDILDREVEITTDKNRE